MRALFCNKADYYRLLSQIAHLELVHVVFEPDGVSSVYIVFISLACCYLAD